MTREAITRGQFEARVQACQDERRDPLDDDAVVAWLEAHAEDLERFAAEREALSTLATLGRPTRSRARLAFAAAAATLLVAGFAFLRSGPEASRGRILAASFEEIVPLARAAASFYERDVMIDTCTARLEFFTLRSERR